MSEPTFHIHIQPGYSGPATCHPAHLVFELRGPNGSIIADFNLGYYAEGTFSAGCGLEFWGFSIHGRVQLSSDPEPSHHDCRYTEGECYCESWGTGSEMCDKLTLGGAPAIEAELRRLYADKLAHVGENWQI